MYADISSYNLRDYENLREKRCKSGSLQCTGHSTGLVNTPWRSQRHCSVQGTIQDWWTLPAEASVTAVYRALHRISEHTLQELASLQCTGQSTGLVNIPCRSQRYCSVHGTPKDWWTLPAGASVTAVYRALHRIGEHSLQEPASLQCTGHSTGLVNIPCRSQRHCSVQGNPQDWWTYPAGASVTAV